MVRILDVATATPPVCVLAANPALVLLATEQVLFGALKSKSVPDLTFLAFESRICEGVRRRARSLEGRAAPAGAGPLQGQRVMSPIPSRFSWAFSALVVALVVGGGARVVDFVRLRRVAWQRCANNLATTAFHRRPLLPTRWRGLLEPVERGGNEAGIATARLRFPVGPDGVAGLGSFTVIAPFSLTDGPVTVEGVLRCLPPSANGTDADFFAAFRLPEWRIAARAVHHRAPESLRERALAPLVRARAHAGERLRPWPRTFAVARAAWTGEIAPLPGAWQTVLRDGGALAVVALSGQHVALVAGWLVGLLRWAARALPPRGLLLDRVRAVLPVAVAAGFVALGSAAPSTIRAAATVVAAATFRRRGLHVTPLRVAIVTAALTVVAFPEFLASPGYLLSVVGAVGIATVGGVECGRARSAKIAVLLPLWLAPIVVYCFARLPLATIVVATAVGFLWEGLVLPVAFFLLPWIDGMPERWLVCLASASEWGLAGAERGLLALAPWLAATVVVLPVPTPLELALGYGAVSLWCVRRRKPLPPD